MPNYFAHLTFGRQVRQALPEDLRRKLRAEGPAFELGCLGPDILFFYHLLAPSTARNEGHTMHRSSALPVFWRLRAAITAGTPMAAGYAAGFLCHLALDSTCHPYVNAKAAQGEISHLAMEAEFDRWLMRRAGLPSRGCAHMPAPMDRAVYRAAACAYLHAGPREVERGFLAMRRDTALLAGLYDAPTGRLAAQICGALPPLRNGQGILLQPDPAPACAETTPALLELLESAVPTAVRQLTAFFDAAAQGADLDPWLNRDFEGKVYHSA